MFSGCFEDKTYTEQPDRNMDLFSSKKVKCAGCGNNIDKKEPKVEAMKKPWHAACFVCQQCHKPLQGDFRAVDDRPWCDNCYAKHKAPKCGGCGKGILEKRIKTDDGRSFHEECFAKASQGTCFICNDNIGLSEPVTEALGKQFHERCFRCSDCGGDLPEKFHLQNDRPVCNKCHKKNQKEEQHDQPPEYEDTQTIVKDAGPNLTEVTEYHESTRTVKNDDRAIPTETLVRSADASFAGGQDENQLARNDFGQPRHRVTNIRDDVQGTDCAVCAESTEQDTHVAAKGRHFHRNCYDNAHSGECNGCGQKIRLVEPSVSVGRLGRDWHTSCLNCSKCFSNISSSFQMHNDTPICDGCFRQHVAPQCAACGQSIDGDKLKALNNMWHPGCFNCSVCSVPLIEKGREFFNVEGRPYCKDDLEAQHIKVVG